MRRGTVCLAVSLLVGLSGCGSTQPDPLGHAAPAPPSKPIATAISNHQTHPFNSEANASLPTAPASALARSTTHAQTQTKTQTSASPESAGPALADRVPTAAARQQWLAEARAHPEVTVRRQALELWAEQASQDLDPVTYALVDEDDTIRTRAQELYEQQLAREAAEAQFTVSDNTTASGHQAERGKNQDTAP